jgi:hypothetical protein
MYLHQARAAALGRAAVLRAALRTTGKRACAAAAAAPRPGAPAPRRRARAVAAAAATDAPPGAPFTITTPLYYVNAGEEGGGRRVDRARSRAATGRAAAP